MAKPLKREKARNLRRKGFSLSEIANKVNISKGSASLWCRDIKLTEKQIERLDRKQEKGFYRGRLKGARKNKEKKQKRIRKAKERAEKLLTDTRGKKRNLLFLGIGIYMGEGSKTHRKVKINNSNPEIIKIILKWFREVWNIDDERLTLRLSVNEVYENEVDKMKNFWINKTGLSEDSFSGVTIIQVKNKKNYKNYSDYHGTLTISVKNPANLYYTLLALMTLLTKGRCSSGVRANAS